MRTTKSGVIKCFVQLDRVGLCEPRRRLIVELRGRLSCRLHQQPLACGSAALAESRSRDTVSMANAALGWWGGVIAGIAVAHQARRTSA